MSFFARAFGAAMCGFILAAAGTSSADMVDGTRSELLVERAHAIRLTMHRDHAELVVRRTVHNGGPSHDQAVFGIDLPETAVATGLRTLGSLRGRPHWENAKVSRLALEPLTAQAPPAVLAVRTFRPGLGTLATPNTIR